MLDDIFHTIFHTNGEDSHLHEQPATSPHEQHLSDPHATGFYTGTGTGAETHTTPELTQTHFQSAPFSDHEPAHTEYNDVPSPGHTVHEVQNHHQHEYQDLQPHHHDAFVQHQPHQDMYGAEPIPVYEPPTTFHGIGHPEQYSHYWQHQTGEDCAVMAQGEILESITGVHLTEQQLCQIAQDHHWYDPQKGTMPEDIGKILSYEGIPVTHTDHATVENLAQALQNNQRVIVGLNANEIWHPQHDPTTGQPAQLPYAGHAVWVTGMEQEPDGNVKVILTDSAPENGQVEVVDLHDFLNAWSDSGNLMVTTAPYPSV